MMEKFCALVAKAALALLLLNGVMLLFVERGSAEQIVTILSIIMMAILFAASSAKLRKRSGKDNVPDKEDKEKKER